MNNKISNSIWHPFTPLLGSGDPIAIKSANGLYLETEDNKLIMDAISSWWVNLHGHSNKEIAKAIWEQAQVLEHVIFAGFTHEPARNLANNLLTILPSNQRKIFFSDNGSTAVEVAIKMAIQYWKNILKPRKKIIAIEGAYHGDTFGAMSVGERGMFTDPFKTFLFDVDFIPFPFKGEEQKTIDCFKLLVKKEDVAAFIYEPLVQGAAGMRIYDKSVLEELIRIVNNHEIISIADEVFTGFCRTGKYFASLHLSQKPDIMAISKGITGGFLPLGVTSCNDKIVNAFLSDDSQKTLYHGHSYTANPLSCAAANKSFEILTRPSTQQKIADISSLQSRLADNLQGHNKILSVKSLGTILSIELKTKEETSYTNSIRKNIYQHFINKGILLRPLGNVIYALPPYVITDEELSIIHKEIKTFINQL